MGKTKKFLGVGIVAVIVMVALTVGVRAEVKVVADFDQGADTTNLGTKFGAWDKDPDDTTQTCTTSFSDTEKFGDSGKSLQITYDVDSPNPAYNGVWMKLDGLKASNYESLVFQAKGAESGCTNSFKIELKNADESSSCLVSGVTTSWQKIVIPLAKFEGLTDLNSLTEMVIIFDDINVTTKVGNLYIDDIAFE